MSGVSVDSNENSGSSQADLTAVMNGGENFLARMKLLTEARDANLKATENLRLGIGAQEAMAKVATEREQLTRDRKRLQDESSAASTAAAALRVDVDRRARQKLAEAEASLTEARAQAAAVLGQAKAQADQLVAAAKAAADQHEAIKADLASKLDAATQAHDDHVSARDVHASAATEADRIATRYSRMIRVLQDAIAAAEKVK